MKREFDSNTWCHDHDFACSSSMQRNERRTWLVIIVTAGMMVVEVAAGFFTGSMALLADGWHMASHAAALSITAMGYYFSRHYSNDSRFSFGTGKVGELAGYTSAVVLALIALLMGYESVKRLLSPVSISFDEAIFVAFIGLVVNVVCALILRDNHSHPHHHAHEGSPVYQHDHSDHNLKSAYFHVLADALTSFLAIFALIAGRFLGALWMDPMMGMVGFFVISYWAFGLARQSGGVLLDMEPHESLARDVKSTIESQTNGKVVDLHVWRVGQGHYCAIVSIVTPTNETPESFKNVLSRFTELSHVTVEVNQLSQ